MKEIYHGVEIEVLRERSHMGWTALFWSLIKTSTWTEIDAGVEKDGSIKKMMDKLKERVDNERRSS